MWNRQDQDGSDDPARRRVPGQREVLWDGNVSAHLAWVVPEDVRAWTEGRDAASWLSRAEQKDLSQDPSRAADRMAARLALKLLVREQDPFRELPLSAIETEPDEHGRPRLRLEGHQHLPRVSLSHARAWGAAGLSWGGLVGVDIEHERPGLERVRRRLLGPEEPAEGTRELLATWVVKEAAVKAFGAGIDLHLTDVGVTLGEAGRATVRMPGSVTRWDPSGVLEGEGRWFDLGKTAVAIVQFSTREQFF